MNVLDAYPWVRDRFDGVKEERGGRSASAACPIKCHRHARMNFALGSEGQLLVKCWAGCDNLEALRAVGCGWKDCFPGQLVPDRSARRETAYPYHDECGRVLYQAVRLEPGYRGKDKAFFRRRPRPGGGWINDLDGVRFVLYRLRELIGADPAVPVHVVAGEKDADNLRAIGLVATTNIGGESTPWRDRYSEALAGRDVVVIEDRDSAGQRHANEVCGSLMGYARSVRRVVFAEKDATAFLIALRRLGITTPAEQRACLAGAANGFPRWVVG